MAVPAGKERDAFNKKMGYLSRKSDGSALDTITDIEAGVVPCPDDNEEYVYKRIGTHLVLDFHWPLSPEYDDIIPMNRLVQFEQLERQERLKKTARKAAMEAAKKAGEEYVEPVPKAKWKWYEHYPKLGERRKPRFGPDGKRLVDNKGQRLSLDGDMEG
jgi:hypothetical protein